MNVTLPYFYTYLRVLYNVFIVYLTLLFGFMSTEGSVNVPSLGGKSLDRASSTQIPSLPPGNVHFALVLCPLHIQRSLGEQHWWNYTEIYYWVMNLNSMEKGHMLQVG